MNNEYAKEHRKLTITYHQCQDETQRSLAVYKSHLRTLDLLAADRALYESSWSAKINRLVSKSWKLLTKRLL